MRDFIGDWKKWSHAERMFAAALALLLLAMPLGLLMPGHGGSLGVDRLTTSVNVTARATKT